MTHDQPEEELPAGLGNVPPAALEDWAPPRRRRWPYVLGGLVLVVGGLLAAGPSIVSGSWLNGVIRNWLETNVETPVSFERLEVSWGDGIRMEGLSVRDSIGSESHLLYAREVEMQASITSLFVRHLDVERLVFHDTVVRIEHTGGGRLNSEDVVRMETKKRRRQKPAAEQETSPTEPEEALVLPEIDVPIDVRNLTLIFVTDDGREIARPGITFRGDVSTRKGPTTFSLKVPDGDGALTVDGSATLFDEEGVLLPRERLALVTTIGFDGIDARDNADLIAALGVEGPSSGLLEGTIDVDSEGASASGTIDLSIRNFALGDAVGRTSGDQPDLRVTGAFQKDASSLRLDGLSLQGQGLDARADLGGAFDALEGSATFAGDVARIAAALRAFGISLPAGIAGAAEGRIDFTRAPSRGEGRFRLTGLHVPPMGDATDALHMESLEGNLALRPEADAIAIESATLAAPSFTLSATGELEHAGAFHVTTDVTGDVAALLAHGRALGVVPRDLAIAGDLSANASISLDPGDAGPDVTTSVTISNDGMQLSSSATLAPNGDLDAELSGKGSLESLLPSRGAEDGDDVARREVRGTFEIAASVSGTQDAPLAVLDRLVITGDLDVDGRGEFAPDGAIDGTLSVRGVISDAISLARGLGLVEGDIPIEGSIDAHVSVAGTRERPQIPTASLTVSDGPVTVEATASLDVDGIVSGSFVAVAELDAVWRIAHAQGLLQRPHATGGTVTAKGVLDGTRRAIEVPTATLRVKGPIDAQVHASYTADQEASVRCNFRGALGEASELLAAALGIDAHRLVGDYDGAVAVEGPLDALEVDLSHFGLRAGELTADGHASMHPDGDVEAALVLRGPLADALDVARAADFARTLEGEGRIDASFEARVTGRGTARAAVGAIDAGVFDLRLAHTDGSDAVFREDEIRLSVPAIRYSLGGDSVRPMRAELEVGRRMRVDATISGGGSRRDLDAEVTASGRMQILLDALAFVTQGASDRFPADFDATIRATGSPDDLLIEVPALRVVDDEETFALDVTATHDSTGLAATASAKGELRGIMALAHAAGLGVDTRATGSLDAATEIRLVGDQLAVRSLRTTVDDLRLTPSPVGEGTFHEPRFAVTVERVPTAASGEALFTVDLAKRTMSAFRPTVSMDGLSVSAIVAAREESRQEPENGDEAAALVASVTEGSLDISSAFVANHPELFPDTTLGKLHAPFRFEGDVAAGRDRAATWTGGFDLDVTDLRAPYANVASATAKGTLTDGALVLDPVNARVNGGTADVTASIGLVGERPEHSAKIDAKDVEISGDLGPLLARVTPLLAVGEAGTSGGSVGIDADLTAKGLDGDRIKRTISGEGRLRLDGVYAQSDNWVGQLMEFIGAGSRLEVADADVPFTIDRGRVTTGNVDIAGKELDLRMGGEVSTAGDIDYGFNIKPHREAGAFSKFAKLLDADGYLPLRLEGDLSSPKLDFPSLADVAGGSIKGLFDKLRGKDDEDDADEDDELSDEERKKRRRQRRKRKKQREAEEAARKAAEEEAKKSEE